MLDKKRYAARGISLLVPVLLLLSLFPVHLFAASTPASDGRYRFSALEAVQDRIDEIYGMELLLNSQSASVAFRVNVNSHMEDPASYLEFCSRDVTLTFRGAYIVELIPGEPTPVTYMAEKPLFEAGAQLAAIAVLPVHGQGLDVEQVTWLDADGSPLGVSLETVEPTGPSLPDEDEFLLLLLGDSIPHGAGLQDASRQGYGALVADELGYFLRNLAIGGDTSADLRAIVEKWYWYYPTIQRADAIVVSIGGNDFLQDMATLLVQLMVNNYTKLNEVLEKMEDNLAAILDTIRMFNPDAPVLVQTLYNPQSISLGRRTYQKGLDLLNPMIIRLVNSYENMYVVELEQPFADAYNAGDRSLIQGDMTHPSAAGHALIAETLKETLYSNGLVTEFANLIALLAEVQLLQTEGYTPATVLAFEMALASAQTIAHNARSRQETVDAACHELRAAMEALQERADLEALRMVVQEAEQLDESSYTVESYAILSAALTNAYSVLNDENAAQNVVDEAAMALREAMDNLVSRYVPVESLAIENGPSITLYEGDSLQLTVRINPEDASDPQLEYASSNDAVCIVDDSGLLVATGYGSTRVTVTASNGVRVTVTVRVL